MLLELDFFKSENEVMMDKLDSIKESSERVRKGIFAKHGELVKKYMDLSDRLEIIERNICRRGIDV